MSDTVITVEGVSKKFSRTTRHVMRYGLQDVARNAVGLRSQSERLRDGEFWALDDVSFEVKRGETLGIIGPNGSGKSTLLKLLNGIFLPDRGAITVAGRVGALVEVGAGFHPQLTGRENIYVNGTILGLSRSEIHARLDDIIEFADIGEFIDAPVKHYSSGMHVRLGFSVAVHCRADILLIDEILSVGDLAFQKKCLDKIHEHQQRMAVVFVSHNIRHVTRLCNGCLLLGGGRRRRYGSTAEVVNQYLDDSKGRLAPVGDLKIVQSIDGFAIESVDIRAVGGAGARQCDYGRPMAIRIGFHAHEDIDELLCHLSCTTMDGMIATILSNEESPLRMRKGRAHINCVINNVKLVPGTYLCRVKLRSRKGYVLVEADLGEFVIRDQAGGIKPTLGVYREHGVWKLDEQAPTAMGHV